MATDDARLSLLTDAANAAELRHFALGVSHSQKITGSGEGPSASEVQATAQALSEWNTARHALEAYKASERWATNRD